MLFCHLVAAKTCKNVQITSEEPDIIPEVKLMKATLWVTACYEMACEVEMGWRSSYGTPGMM